jgi:hypothetical protein
VREVVLWNAYGVGVASEDEDPGDDVSRFESGNPGPQRIDDADEVVPGSNGGFGPPG